MKMSKKVLSLILALTMVTMLLAGCGKKETIEPVATTVKAETEAPATEAPVAEVPAVQPEEGATLLVWEDGSTSEWMEYCAQEFQKVYPGVTVTVEAIGHTDTVSKIELDGPTGLGADLYAAPHDHVGRIAASGLALPNDMFPEYFTEDNFYANALAGPSAGGVFYGYPTAVETYSLFYNKDLVPTPAATFDEIVTFAGTFNDAASNKYAIMWDVANAYFTYGFLGGYADLFGPKGDDKTQLGFDTPAGTEALTYYQSLRGIYDVPAADANGVAMDAAFTSGNAAYVITGPWSIQTYKDAGINFGIAKLPTLGNGETPKSFSGVRGLFVSSYTKFPVAAKMFGQFVTTTEMQQKRYDMTNTIPANKNVVVADEYLQGILEQFNFSFPMPTIPEMNFYWSTMGATYANIWNGNDVQTELDAAAKAIQDAIAIQ